MDATDPTGREHGGAINCLLPPDARVARASGPCMETGDTPVAPDGPMPPELIDPDDAEIDDVPGTDDDSNWDVFIPDEDECDPLPEPGDFWIEPSQEPRVESREPWGRN